MFQKPPYLVSHGIPNLFMVAPGIFSGGQFNDEGLAWLKSQGVTRRLKLNTEREGFDPVGLQTRYDPVSVWQQIGLAKIDPERVNADLAFISLGLCFFGCEHGQDRTGLMRAIYRVRVMGWTKDAAEKEMVALGFHNSLHGLHEFWEDFQQ